MYTGGSDKHTNRLIGERSPYLLGHAHNPVEWYPWGDEAFERARSEGKPVFLSIGYSACHWCHVMARESFEDDDVARILNESFISVKVDREERPDVDAVYMRAAQALSSSGGWPLTIVMTPDGAPFFAATYVPKLNAYGRVGLMELLPRIRDMWSQKRDEIVASAREISSLLGRMAVPEPGGSLGEDDLRLGFEALAASFDARLGGFGVAPKFPAVHNLTFLLRYYRRYGEQAALAMVETTLDRMRMGGIHDHVGGGFHRYSTDAEWRIPHFEKMLSDQALISIAYMEAYQATGREEFGEVARSTLDYAIRDLRLPEGGFCCSEGADSEGGEGAFYAWTMKELRHALADEEMKLITQVFGASDAGNTKGEFAIRGEPANILHMDIPVEEIAERYALDPGEFMLRVERILKKLFDTRLRRPRPERDDKVLADWNGLMIAALAIASSLFGRKGYLEAAKSAADFVLDRMRSEGRGLVHSLRDAQEPIAAFADDYAFTVWGLIELYQASFEWRYLEKALELNDILMSDFGDDSGFVFTTSKFSAELPARIAESFDGATPSANSVHARNLVMISRITGETSYERTARAVMDSFASQVRAAPQGHTFMLGALDCDEGPPVDVVVAGEPGAPDTEGMLSAIRRPFVPDMLILMRGAGFKADPMDRMGGFVAQCESVDGKATAYICRGRACLPPVTDADEALAALLDKD